MCCRDNPNAEAASEATRVQINNYTMYVYGNNVSAGWVAALAQLQQRMAWRPLACLQLDQLGCLLSIADSLLIHR